METLNQTLPRQKRLLLAPRSFSRRWISIARPETFLPLGEIKLTTVSDTWVCERIWKACSDQSELWNLWDFRKIFIDVYGYPLHFVVAWHEDLIVGVLPVWYEKQKKYYEWVGGWWAEQSVAFCRDSGIVLKMVKSLKKKVNLEGINEKDASLFNGLVKRDLDQYGLNLVEAGNSWEGYLATLKKKKRYNIKRDIKRILAMRPVVRYNRGSDLEEMFRLNSSRMSIKSKIYDDEDESMLDTEVFMKDAFRQMWARRGKKFRTRIITVLVGGRVVGCDLGMVYNGKYYSMLGGLDVDSVPGIGSFMNMLDIQDAINQGCSYVDFCMEDHHWKHSWFAATPRYKVITGGK